MEKNQKQKDIYQDDYELDDAAQNYTTELDPGYVLEHQQRLDLLSEAIATLPPRRREAFVLYRFDGLSQSEIAEQMDISISMVENILQQPYYIAKDMSMQDRRNARMMSKPEKYTGN